MPLAPNANFSGIIKRVGEVVGGGDPGVSFNNQLIGFRDENIPVLVGMGNAIKIFIAYELSPAIGFEKVTINLYWIQRVQSINVRFGTPRTFPSGDKIIRTLDNGRSNYNCNHVPYFDVIASDYASPSDRINERQMNWQVIDLPLVDPPIDPTILPAVPVYRSGARGVIYETTAKADELFLYTQVTPDVLVTDRDSVIIVDIAIGSNAAGESK